MRSLYTSCPKHSRHACPTALRRQLGFTLRLRPDYKSSSCAEQRVNPEMQYVTLTSDSGRASGRMGHCKASAWRCVQVCRSLRRCLIRLHQGQVATDAVAHLSVHTLPKYTLHRRTLHTLLLTPPTPCVCMCVWIHLVAVRPAFRSSPD